MYVLGAGGGRTGQARTSGWTEQVRQVHPMTRARQDADADAGSQLPRTSLQQHVVEQHARTTTYVVEPPHWRYRLRIIAGASGLVLARYTRLYGPLHRCIAGVIL